VGAETLMSHGKERPVRFRSSGLERKIVARVLLSVRAGKMP
jgi:hypothetical protein